MSEIQINIIKLNPKKTITRPMAKPIIKPLPSKCIETRCRNNAKYNYTYTVPAFCIKHKTSIMVDVVDFHKCNVLECHREVREYKYCRIHEQIYELDFTKIQTLSMFCSIQISIDQLDKQFEQNNLIKK